MPSEGSRLTRRQLLSTAVGSCAALAVPSVLPGRVLGMDGAVAPSERIVLGAIGLGGRGTGDLHSFMGNADVQFVAICDVRKERREAIKKAADSRYGNSDCAMYRDMHEILARPDIDAMLIATGDRWHTMASITACKAGKDVYSEKPCSTTIAESQALADTYRKYGRIYQAGTQRRSIGNFIFAAELVASGKLGKLGVLQNQRVAAAEDHLADRRVGRDLLDCRLPILDSARGPTAAEVPSEAVTAMDSAGGGCYHEGSACVLLEQAGGDRRGRLAQRIDAEAGRRGQFGLLRQNLQKHRIVRVAGPNAAYQCAGDQQRKTGGRRPGGLGQRRRQTQQPTKLRRIADRIGQGRLPVGAVWRRGGGFTLKC